MNSRNEIATTNSAAIPGQESGDSLNEVIK
jgi:hypothetical protein